MKFFKEKFRKIKKLPTWLFFPPYLLLLGMSWCLFRRRLVDPLGMTKNGRGLVTVTWHNRLLYFPALFPRDTRKRTIAVVSSSRDGQYVSDLISHFGIQSVRGSSKKGGANALLGAIKAMRDGYNISFTPDGPRGPKYKMSRGPIHLASQAQTSVLPISINASRYWEIKSWDRFQIPKPFSTLTLVFGDPIPIPAELDDEQMEQFRLKVEQALMKITEDRPKKS